MAVARYPGRMSRSDPRLYLEVPDVTFSEGLELPLPAGQAHYLGNVMRQGPGDAVRVFNARDGEWAATIQTLRKDRGTIVFGTMERPPQATEGVELLFAPLKRDATELVIRMGTELGVTCFRPVITERTNTHRLNLDRLTLIASEAAEQCERLDIPEILPLEPLKTVLSTWPNDKPLFAALERRPGENDPEKAAALLIGPEGGFSDAEVSMLQRHSAVHALTLGPLVLRAETAVCAGLARLALRRGA
ncbi:16S rRNA methyltransferase [Gluconobacter oxydans]|uniref:16S rRNA (uracil(1498)-N(3))-methyltransferase n=1 Tax=Gluconobacter thailandicus TaxID=257438 RepID=UPI000299749E|nr:16S rRNA (uracil(1498)-N(3))-methyltransferase [Gluconobacter thailandicus]AFV99617.1 16S ribosomal RNA methyltransferase RsmE [Gluconobacter oxydans H24]ANQ41525.1 16S rRNA methyltransferase [Gluconobacter oxydans]